jgi:glutaredoxin
MTMFVVFGKAGCPACHSAKHYLSSKNKQHIYFDLEVESNSILVLRGLLPQVKTVPQIFIVEENVTTLEQLLKVSCVPVGGFTDLQKYLEDVENGN